LYCRSLFVLFHLVIMLSVVLRFTDSVNLWYRQTLLIKINHLYYNSTVCIICNYAAQSLVFCVLCWLSFFFLFSLSIFIVCHSNHHFGIFKLFMFWYGWWVKSCIASVTTDSTVITDYSLKSIHLRNISSLWKCNYR
jgi:hypothetical protein